jgi:electron transfer flavoprotein beta subunit
VGMQNMRGIMPALQKAQPAPVGAESINFLSIEVPKQQRDTRIVKDMPVDQIAREIVDWIKS